MARVINSGGQAIETKFHGPTNSRGARVSARAEAGRKTIPWDDEFHVFENHARAAEALARSLGWDGEMVGGAPPNHAGYVFVFVTRNPRAVSGRTSVRDRGGEFFVVQYKGKRAADRRLSNYEGPFPTRAAAERWVGQTRRKYELPKTLFKTVASRAAMERLWNAPSTWGRDTTVTRSRTRTTSRAPRMR